MSKYLIGHSGLNLNNFYVTRKALKKAVKNSKGKILPLTNSFMENEVIGAVSNLEYKNGKVYAKVDLLKFVNRNQKVIRCAYRLDKQIQRKTYITADSMSVEFCGLIDKGRDAERKIRK